LNPIKSQIVFVITATGLLHSLVLIDTQWSSWAYMDTADANPREIVGGPLLGAALIVESGKREINLQLRTLARTG
jgi:hypothetical protein